MLSFPWLKLLGQAAIAKRGLRPIAFLRPDKRAIAFEWTTFFLDMLLDVDLNYLVI